jgi:DNA-binding response OmpR family regulator
MSKPVIVIEDDPEILDLLTDVLNHIGLPVVKKKDTISLPELASINPPLVLLDHWLYSGYGADYCKQIKENPETSHIPVILVSAVSNLKEVSKTARADGYISKPFDLNYLEAKVKEFTT